MKLKSIIKIFILFAAFAYLIIWYDAAYNRWSDKKIKNSILSGYNIVKALNKYYIKEKRYPENLEFLIPEYLSKIEKPSAGEGKWRYSREGEKYKLSFQKETNKSFPYFYYDIIYEEWIEVKK
ncbi:MAG: hypothetical protein OEZ13_00140 [Spirochaetia bacterium]|nr:hypothetical protein [Spirochaetia bacterium]